MFATIMDDAGHPLDAKVEVEAASIVLHSRGGAFGKANLRNPDYRAALRLILDRLAAKKFAPSGIWLDSQVAQKWPESDRLVLGSAELGQPTSTLLKLIGQRAAAKGRPDGASGQGNTTKRLRIGVPGASAAQLLAVLVDAGPSHTLRLPTRILRLVEPWMVDKAVEAVEAGSKHAFGESTDYDVLAPSGARLSPKAVFGIALSEVIGRPAKPSDFSAGLGGPCFEIIENAGYPIVAKGEVVKPADSDADEERSWAEGKPKRMQHLRRERAPALSKAKKKQFIRKHGHLFCERCKLIPSKTLGPHGDACIEVHHHAVAVGKMKDGTRTRLEDLKCLCANCHRIVHRELL